ncbi:MAG TPA: hypothetical protein VLV54_12320 [Thermoanaerobaculia bacterium]|nr:hypothetical protein [Thermoanaerobaculia bacterium]
MSNPLELIGDFLEDVLGISGEELGLPILTGASFFFPGAVLSVQSRYAWGFSNLFRFFLISVPIFGIMCAVAFLLRKPLGLFLTYLTKQIKNTKRRESVEFYAAIAYFAVLLWGFIFLFFLSFTFLTPPRTPEIGGVIISDSSFCLALRNGGLQPGTDLYVVTLDKPQRAIEAKVQEKASEKCGGEANFPGYASYSLIPSPAHDPGFQLGVGLVGLSASPTEEKGDAVAYFWPNRAEVRFRQCTSSEGIHLTAWAGGKRLWHSYYYLGYDTVPTCADKEMSDDGK